MKTLHYYNVIEIQHGIHHGTVRDGVLWDTSLDMPKLFHLTHDDMMSVAEVNYGIPKGYTLHEGDTIEDIVKHIAHPKYSYFQMVDRYESSHEILVQTIDNLIKTSEIYVVEDGYVSIWDFAVKVETLTHGAKQAYEGGNEVKCDELLSQAIVVLECAKQYNKYVGL